MVSQLQKLPTDESLGTLETVSRPKTLAIALANRQVVQTCV
jgi:hypothetical protein